MKRVLQIILLCLLALTIAGCDGIILSELLGNNSNTDDTNGTDDNNGNNDDTTSTSFSIDGNQYTLTHGLISDFGPYDGAGIGTNTHYYLGFELADAEFLPDEATYSAPDSSISIYIAMFSSGTESFDDGAYYYIHFNDVEDYYSMVSENFFEEGTEVAIGVYLEDYVSWGVKSGTVNVTNNGGNNYTLVVDLDIALYDSHDHFIDGTDQSIAFIFSGDFLYELIGG